jgi:pyrrolidone-carboxylate peptidase
MQNSSIRLTKLPRQPSLPPALPFEDPDGTGGPHRKHFLVQKVHILIGRFFGAYADEVMNPSWLVTERVRTMIQELNLPLSILSCDFTTVEDYLPEYAGPQYLALDSKARAYLQYNDILLSIKSDLKYRPCDITLVLGVAPLREKPSIERTAVPWWRLPGDPTRLYFPHLQNDEVLQSRLPNQAIIATCKALGLPLEEYDIEVGGHLESMRPTSCNAAAALLLDWIQVCQPSMRGGLMHTVFTPEQNAILKRRGVTTAGTGIELDTQALTVLIALIETAKEQGFVFSRDPIDILLKNNEWYKPIEASW